MIGNKALGVLFQDFVKYEYKAWENIHFGKADQKQNIKKIIEAAISSGADTMIKKLEHGYEVEKLSKEKTVIIISHRFSTVRNADKIYVIDNGKIVESGSHNQLIELNGQYASLFKLQARGYL